MILIAAVVADYHGDLGPSNILQSTHTIHIATFQTQLTCVSN